MMNSSNRSILYSLYLIMLASICLIIVNFAAPNPTGRWFSSDYVDTTQSGNVFGHEAEAVLAQDLGIVQNDSSDGGRVCFCNQDAATPPGRCNVCEVNSANISTWSIPDFVNNRLIIDSKAVSRFTIDEQISNFIAVAEQSNRPLWIFVRYDTTYSESTLEQIQATGGDIVDYFVVDGYAHLLVMEQAINNILIVAIVFAAGLMIWQFIVVRREDSPSEDIQSLDDVDKAEESVEDTEEYMRRMERLSKRTIKDDKEDRKK